MSGQAAHTPRAADQSGISPSAQTDEAWVAGRYRVEQALGQGGTATVYRAHDTSKDRPVALKRLEKQNHERIASLFELEYYTLASIAHPNVVEVYEYGTDAVGPYYTMELLEGHDLKAHGPVAYQEAARYICQAAAALGMLHARRLVHRDINPRNLWRTPDGQVKVIDFGALAPFGIANYLVGTPPCIAPEAVSGQPIDQRLDLYALGASLYWLLTGTHAYGARHLSDLRSAWQYPFVAPSKRQKERDLPDLPDVPEEIDALVEALLNHNPDARPATTGDLIDRLSALANLGETVQGEGLSRSLQQSAFVGREREKRYFHRRIRGSLDGEGSISFLEGLPGEGRSRLLSELAIEARILGCDVVRVDAKRYPGPSGVMEAVVLRLLEANPESARAAFEPHAQQLALLSPHIQHKLGAPHRSEPSLQIAGELRAHMQNALRAGFEALTQTGPWTILLDDLEAADEGSLAALLALAELTELGPLVIVASINPRATECQQPAIRALRTMARNVALRPFEADETRELVRSLVGDAPRLERLSDKLHRASCGVPGRCMELLHHLVRSEVIAYRDGTWMLPHDLPDRALQIDQTERFAQQIAALSSEAQALASALSVHRGAFALDLCRTLSDLQPAQLFSALSELLRKEVWAGHGDGYVFASEPLRAELVARTDEASRTRAHVRLGRALSAAPDITELERLEAAVHILHGGQDKRALGEVSRLGLHFAMAEPDSLAAAVPSLEQAVEILHAAGRPDKELLALLGPLTVAGYFFDRRLGARYGDRAMGALNAALGLDVARRLRRFLGKKLSFFAGLAVGALFFARRKRDPLIPAFRDATLLFFNCVGALTGAAVICIDPKAVARYSEYLEPWTALGENHLTTFIYRFTQNLLATIQERSATAQASWESIIPVLRDTALCPSLPEPLRLRYLGGALYAYGVLGALRSSPLALEIAEELSDFEIHMYRMSAEQVRTSYYSNQGNLALFDKHRRKAELFAIQRGSAWQAETWGVGAAITTYHRTHDAMGLKQCYEQLNRLAREVPSLELIARRCRGVYLLVRERFREALPHLESCLEEEPLAVVGWGRTHGALAAALNGLGQHARAQVVCQRALSALSPGDLEFTAMNLGLQIEAAVAEAGLGEHAAAQAALEALFERHGEKGGPLALGALHEAAAQLALLRGDHEECGRHLQEVERVYASTAIPSLIARASSLIKRTTRSVRRRTRADDASSHTTTGGGASTQHSVNTGEAYLLDHAINTQTPTSQSFTEEALSIVIGKSRATCGALWAYTNGTARPLATAGERQVPEAICAWAEERITLVRDDVTDTDAEQLSHNPDVRKLNGRAYQFILLSKLDNGKEETVGGLVLGRAPRTGLFYDYPLLRALADKVSRDLDSGG